MTGFRFVVDETSFVFGDCSDDDIDRRVDGFNDLLDDVQRKGDGVAVSPLFDATECRPEVQLWELLYTPDGPLDYDTRLRLARLIDRCDVWEEPPEGVCATVTAGAAELEMAWSVAYAAHESRSLRGRACLALPGCGRQGRTTVICEHGAVEVFFAVTGEDLPAFWRSLYALESISESEFFRFADRAFPNLEFAGSLSFGKFEGSYTDLRPWVVHALGVLNDVFPDAYADYHGRPHEIQRRLGSHGINASPESPLTRSKPGIIRQRDVRHDDETVRCEWHMKKEPHRNRIHFAVPDQRRGGRILVGIFVRHLDT